MSMPICPDHGEKAIYRNSLGYFYCSRCLDALFEWYAWIYKNAIIEEKRPEVMEKNHEIAEEHIQSAISWYERHREIYPELRPPARYDTSKQTKKAKGKCKHCGSENRFWASIYD